MFVGVVRFGLWASCSVLGPQCLSLRSGVRWDHRVLNQVPQQSMVRPNLKLLMAGIMGFGRCNTCAQLPVLRRTRRHGLVPRNVRASLYQGLRLRILCAHH